MLSTVAGPGGTEQMHSTPFTHFMRMAVIAMASRASACAVPVAERNVRRRNFCRVGMPGRVPNVHITPAWLLEQNCQSASKLNVALPDMVRLPVMRNGSPWRLPAPVPFDRVADSE